MTNDRTELAARESIRDLVSRYCVEADSGRLDRVVALFAPDGAIEFRGEKHVGAEGITAMFTAAGAKAGKATALGRVLHTVSSTTVDFDGPGTGRARSYFLVLSARGADHWGRYRDEFTRIDDTWLFRRRTITVDGFTPGGLGELLS